MKGAFVFRQTVFQVVLSDTAGLYSIRSLHLFRGDFITSIRVYGYLSAPAQLNDLKATFAFQVTAENNSIPDSDNSASPPPAMSVPLIPSLTVGATRYSATQDNGGVLISVQATWDQSFPMFFRADSTSQHLVFGISPDQSQIIPVITVVVDILSPKAVTDTPESDT